MKTQSGQIDLASFNVLQNGKVTIPGVTSPSASTHYTKLVTVNHNLGYIPQYLIYVTVPMLDWYGDQKYNQTILLPQGIQENSTTTSNGNFYFLGALCDTQNLYIYNNAYTHTSVTDIPDLPAVFYIFNGTTS